MTIAWRWSYILVVVYVKYSYNNEEFYYAGVPDEIALAPGAPSHTAPRAPRRLLQHHANLQPRRQPHSQLGQEGLQCTQA